MTDSFQFTSTTDQTVFANGGEIWYLYIKWNIYIVHQNDHESDYRTDFFFGSSEIYSFMVLIHAYP